MDLKDIQITRESFNSYDENGAIKYGNEKTVIKYIGQIVAVFKDDPISEEAIEIIKNAITAASK